MARQQDKLAELPAASQPETARRLDIDFRKRARLTPGDPIDLAERPRRAGWRKRLLPMALLATGLAILAGWTWWTYGRAIEVPAVRVAAAAFLSEASAPATLDALTKATVAARVQGRIALVARDVGDQVRAGELLVRLDEAELRGNFENAVAAETVARRGIELARAEHARAEAALANASAQFERAQRLKDQGWTSGADFDTKRAALRSAEADVTRATAAITQAEAQADAAAATVRTQRVRLEDAEVRAPFDGIITQRSANAGDVVGPSNAVLELAAPESLIMTARFDESAMGRLAPRLTASVRFHSAPERRHAATIIRVGRRVDGETREVTADLRLDAPPAHWALGQRADVRVILGRSEDTLAVPSRLVVWHDRRPHVWVLAEGRARLRTVVLGETGGDRIAIRAGLSPGEHVLEPARLYPFRPVRAAVNP